jgi:hemoglobin-like flavoprotein
MTPEQVTLVQQTSDILLSVQPHVADDFYRRLFELAPETRRFFQQDLSSQKAKLTGMLASLIGVLGRPDVFSSIIVRLGEDHARLGILPRYYEPAGMALIGAMELSLGPRFTPDVREAWTALYLAIQDRMLDAGYRR